MVVAIRRGVVNPKRTLYRCVGGATRDAREVPVLTRGIMADAQRIKRIQSRIRQDIAELLLSELKDPRIRGLISITRVEVTRDLAFAKVFYSVLGSESDQRTAARFIEDAKGYIQSRVADQLEIRTAPRLTFLYDDSIEKQAAISKIIDEAVASDQKGKPDTGTDDE
jgi:ribosome-binding factor A